MGLADMASQVTVHKSVCSTRTVDLRTGSHRQKEETTPAATTSRRQQLRQRKISWFGESSRLLEFDRPLTEPGASKLTKVFSARRTADAGILVLGQRAKPRHWKSNIYGAFVLILRVNLPPSDARLQDPGTAISTNADVKRTSSAATIKMELARQRGAPWRITRCSSGQRTRSPAPAPAPG